MGEILGSGAGKEIVAEEKPGYNLNLIGNNDSFRSGHKVTATFQQKPLSQALQALSDQIGASVVIDPRVGEKIKMPVSATFTNDVSMKVAVIVLCEMADLKAILLRDVLYVTTAEHARTLEPLQHQLDRDLDPGETPGSGSGIPGIPGIPGLPGVGLPKLPGGNSLASK